MLPTHTDDGFLPAGIHSATWAEVVARFSGSTRRLRLLEGLHAALVHLAGACCRQVFIGGSFVTAKPEPKDVDVVWDVRGVDIDEVHAVFLDLNVGRTATLAIFGAEFFPSSIIEADSRLPFVEFFQRRKSDHTPIGIVVVSLDTLEDDAP